MLKNALVIVDPQNDFCDEKGSLYVQGASADIARLSAYIEKMGESLEGIFVSLDSHDNAAIFHPTFWLDGAGRHPKPFTQITKADLDSAKWKTASSQPFAERTFGAMESKGISSLTIWPEHCVVSTWGHEIAAPLRRALGSWREKTGFPVRYVFKGENPYTDQFSIFEGIDDTYPETAFNENLFSRLAEFDQVTFAGEALSHCVRESILSYTRRLDAKRRVCLLTDCTSPVAGFDGDESLALLREAGVLFTKTL
ncbi:MAG: isochorismatase family protein [Synergistaceae bacterium]|jgi:nicotinamidase-related amidase|nr:isochorismatase family protein [Synergistaceae bacterium]